MTTLASSSYFCAGRHSHGSDAFGADLARASHKARRYTGCMVGCGTQTGSCQSTRASPSAQRRRDDVGHDCGRDDGPDPVLPELHEPAADLRAWLQLPAAVIHCYERLARIDWARSRRGLRFFDFAHVLFGSRFPSDQVRDRIFRNMHGVPIRSSHENALRMLANFRIETQVRRSYYT